MFLGTHRIRFRPEAGLLVALLLAGAVGWIVIAPATAGACEDSTTHEARGACSAGYAETPGSPAADEPESSGCCPTNGAGCTAPCCAASAAMTSAGVPDLAFFLLTPVTPSIHAAPTSPEIRSLDRPPRF